MQARIVNANVWSLNQVPIEGTQRMLEMDPNGLPHGKKMVKRNVPAVSERKANVKIKTGVSDMNKPKVVKKK